jgi:hypothetical protein
VYIVRCEKGIVIDDFYEEFVIRDGGGSNVGKWSGKV